MNHDILILHPFLLFNCTYWILMFNSKHLMQLWKVLHKLLCLLKLLQQGCHFSFSYTHALCGMNPTPHARMPMMPNNMSELKHTNQGWCTCICCAWVWNSSHFGFVFFFTWSKAFFSFHFCFVCGLFNIHRNVVLSPKTPRWIDGCLNLPNCIWRPFVWSKCLWSIHLAT